MELNGINYERPVKPLAVVCIDGGDPEYFQARILGMVDQFNLSTDDVKDLSIAALIAKMIGLARTDSIRNELQGLLGMAKSTGIAGNQASSIVTAKAAQGDA